MKKYLLALLAALAVALLFAVGASAAPALSIELAYSQPNGQIFYATAFGDEFFSYVLSRSGAALTREPDGWWVYAGTEVRYGTAPAPAHALSEAALLALQDFERDYDEPFVFPNDEHGLRPQDFTGEQRLLVLLVEFNDMEIRYEDYWAERIFGEENSVRAFFDDMSRGMIDLVPAQERQGVENDGIVRVRLNRSHPNTVNNTGIANWLIARDALRAAVCYVDFTSFDRNGNLLITSDELHVLMIVAGYEAAFNQNNQPNVWGHHWSNVLWQYGFIGGRIFTSYMQIGERHGDHMATIGIIAHELGHSFGLPDFYTSANSHYPGLGMYCLMASGSWGRYPVDGLAGDTPTALSAFNLELLGLETPQVIAFGEHFDGTVNSLCSGERNILRINVPGHPYEYFLIENRQFSGWDAGMVPWMSSAVYGASGGIAVYRVNNRYRGNLRRGQQVVLLEAVSFRDALFHVYEDRNATLDRFTEPSNTWLAGNASGWFRFEALSESAPMMDIEVVPIITIRSAPVRLNYRRGQVALQVHFAAEGPLIWQVEDENIVIVCEEGIVRAQRRRGSTVVAVFDAEGNADAIRVDVQYAWWQWIIVILLFGWIWY